MKFSINYLLFEMDPEQLQSLQIQAYKSSNPENNSVNPFFPALCSIKLSQCLGKLISKFVPISEVFCEACAITAMHSYQPTQCFCFSS